MAIFMLSGLSPKSKVSFTWHYFDNCPPPQDSTFIIRYSIRVRLWRIRFFIIL
jgi:hypothetical protein